MAEPAPKEETNVVALNNTGMRTIESYADVMTPEEMEAYSGAGIGTDPSEQLVPFLYVLQKGSPQVNDRDPAYIEGAKAGMILNTANGMLWDAERGEGPVLVQFHNAKVWNEWHPRSSGGGFVKQHSADSGILKQAREERDPAKPDSRPRLMLPGGTQLIETGLHFVIIADDFTPAIVTLSSTGLQSHRRWNAIYTKKTKKLQGVDRPRPAFLTPVRLRTVWRKNEQGDWFQLEAEDLGDVQDRALIREAMKLVTQVREGKFNTNATPSAQEQTGDTEGSGSAETDDSPL